MPTAALIETKKLMDEYFDLIFTTIDEEMNELLKTTCLETFQPENGPNDYKTLKNEFKRQIKAMIHDLNKQNFDAVLKDFYYKMDKPVLYLKSPHSGISTDKLESIKVAYDKLSRCGVQYF